MSTSKKINISYFNIEAAEDDYFKTLNFGLNHTKILSFESGDLKYLAKNEELCDLGNEPAYLLSLVKERKLWPMLFTDEGATELSFAPHLLGETHYALVCPTQEFILCTGIAAGFKKMLGQFSPEGVVRLNPYFEGNIDERVMSWDSYKKISLRMNMPSGEDVTNFQSSKAGKLMKIMGYLGGLKVDITVSAGAGKELLSNMMVKDLLPELLVNDLCTSLAVRGSDFENANSEQYDLKNAQIKYSEILEIDGNYITPTEAKQVLLRAAGARHTMLFDHE